MKDIKLTDNYATYLSKDRDHYVIQNITSNKKGAYSLGQNASFKDGGVDYLTRIVKIDENNQGLRFRVILDGSDGFSKRQDFIYKEIK